MNVNVMVVNANTPENRDKGQKLAQALVERMGLGDAIAASLIATQELLLLLMHLPTIDADITLDGVKTLIDNLRRNVVEEHEDCLPYLEQKKQSERVH